MASDVSHFNDNSITNWANSNWLGLAKAGAKRQLGGLDKNWGGGCAPSPIAGYGPVNEKFSTHRLIVLKLVALVPAVIEQYDWHCVADAFRFYSLGQFNLTSEEEVSNEFQQWKAFSLRMPLQVRPQTPLHALDIIPQRYENIKQLLQIFCTLPVTACTAKRTFSASKLLKTYLRNSMTDERLTGLALMYIHPEIDIDIDAVMDRFAARTAKQSSTAVANEPVIPKSRRLQL